MSESFYEQSSFNSIEKVILAEDIKFTEVKDITAKFYVPVMTPTENMNKARNRTTDSYSMSNYINLKIPAYLLLSFMSPKIETIEHDPKICSSECGFAKEQKHKGTKGNKYFLTFEKNSFTIPKGTTFLIAFLGGYLAIDKTYIIGLIPKEVKTK